MSPDDEAAPLIRKLERMGYRVLPPPAPPAEPVQVRCSNCWKRL